MLIGYARVSTSDQNLDLQIDASTKAGCEKSFSEKIIVANQGMYSLNGQDLPTGAVKSVHYYACF